MEKNRENITDSLSNSLNIVKSIHAYAIYGFVGLAIVAVLWSLYGSIPERVTGLGEVNVKQGGNTITALQSGQIENLYIELSDEVDKGDTLFTYRMKEQKNEINQLELQLKELQLKDSLLNYEQNISKGLKSESSDLGRESLKAQIDEVDSTIQYLTNRLQKEKSLYEDGLITYSQLYQTQTSLKDARSEKIRLNQDLKNISFESSEWEMGQDVRQKDLKSEITVLKKKLKDLRDELEYYSVVTAPVDGRIIQLNVEKNEAVGAGEVLSVIESKGNLDNYVLNLYVPFTTNAVIDTGMQVDIEPFTVDQNLYGWLEGKVITVNNYVSSKERIFNELGSRDLVGLIESHGPVYEVTVKLNTDSTTTSGFSWSNGEGPPFKITLGTLAKAHIEVKDKAPIDYVIPIFKSYFE